MARFCGVFSPRDPSLARQQDLRSMLGGFVRETPCIESVFFDDAAGIGIAALSHDNPSGADFGQDDSCTVAFSGYVNLGGVEANGSAGVRAVLETLSRSDTPESLAGEFAIAHWSGPRRVLSLATDPMGKWPIFYFEDEATGLLAFASELKSLLAHPFAQRLADPRGLSLYLFGHNVPAPFTAFKARRRLFHGEVMHVTADGTRRQDLYWSFLSPSSEQRTLAEWSDIVRADMVAALRRVLHGHDKVGLFLGAGRDSSLIYGLLKTELPEVECVPITAHFEEGRHKSPHLDLPYARRLAEHWGDNLLQVELSAGTVGHRLEPLLRQADQPFFDFGNNVSYDALARQAADRGVGVVVTGQAAGEVFGPQSWRGVLEEQELGRLQSIEEIRRHFSEARVFSEERLARLLINPSSTLQDDWRECYERIEERVLSDDPFDRSTFGIRQVSVREHVAFSSIATMALHQVRLFNLFHDWPTFLNSTRIPSEFKGSGDATRFKSLLLERNRHLVPDFVMQRVKRGLPGYVLSNGDFPGLEKRLLSEEVVRAQGIFHPDYFAKVISKKHLRKSLLMAQIWLDIHVFRAEETFALIESDIRAARRA